jgi:hypothetical protein
VYVLGDLTLRCRPRWTVRAFNPYQYDVELNPTLFTVSGPMSIFSGDVISQRLVVGSLSSTYLGAAAFELQRFSGKLNWTRILKFTVTIWKAACCVLNLLPASVHRTTLSVFKFIPVCLGE